MRPEPTVPLNEVTWEEAQARFAKAMEKIYDADAIAEDLNKPRPGSQPENVFDLPDGLRLIVSREDLSVVPGKVLVHASSSCWDPGRRPEHVRSLDDVEAWTLEDLNRVGQFDPPLTLDSPRIKNRMLSPAMVVHFWFTEEP